MSDAHSIAGPTRAQRARRKTRPRKVLQGKERQSLGSAVLSLRRRDKTQKRTCDRCNTADVPPKHPRKKVNKAGKPEKCDTQTRARCAEFCFIFRAMLNERETASKLSEQKIASWSLFLPSCCRMKLCKRNRGGNSEFSKEKFIKYVERTVFFLKLNYGS